LANVIKHTWIDGKLFVRGAVVDDWGRVKAIRKLLQRDNIDVKIVKVQPMPVWEIWGHDKDDDKPSVVEEMPIPIPEGGKFKLTTGGKVAAVEVRTRPPASLCVDCKWFSETRGIPLCDYGIYVQKKKRKCKYYEKREQ